MAMVDLLRPGVDKIAHGGCPTGADRIVHCYATWKGFDVTIYEANWEKQGKIAGPVRNLMMLLDFEPKVVFAFRDRTQENKGTNDCIRKAQKQLIRTVIVEV
jgi:hypothetical protein